MPTFRKPEHLCRQTEIEALFSAGSSATTVYPIRATYRRVEAAGSQGPQVKVLLSVSKRRLKHAVDRNRAKRQLREAYRLQKQFLLDALPEYTGLHVAFIWLSDKPVKSKTIFERMHTILRRIAENTLKAGAAEPRSEASAES